MIYGTSCIPRIQNGLWEGTAAKFQVQNVLKGKNKNILISGGPCLSVNSNLTLLLYKIAPQ